MLLSVLSALARLDLDPWREAASLSRLPAAAATERLSSLLSSLPSSQLTAPAPAAITRLVGLLPKAARDESWSPGAAVLARSKMSWPMVVYFIVAFVMMCAAQVAERGRSMRRPPAGLRPRRVHPIRARRKCETNSAGGATSAFFRVTFPSAPERGGPDAGIALRPPDNTKAECVVSESPPRKVAMRVWLRPSSPHDREASPCRTTPS